MASLTGNLESINAAGSNYIQLEPRMCDAY
jgi:hypothetical protein